ncbi:ExeM/NucH family extracellular endonuclease [Herpetosiphon gulosus]|uniref:LTD domain-containing protein n=1 Tax=Herpetosiphon gulosus TaxID=1973496 RepID=A0ABP9WYL2_9CHLR
MQFKGLRLLTALTMLFTLIGTSLSATYTTPTSAVSTSLVISQFQTAGGTADDEFIEIHNISANPVDLNGHRVVYRAAAGVNDVSIASWTTSVVIPAGGFYLLGRATSYDGTVTADTTFGSGISGTGGGFAIRNGALNTGTIIDSVGFGGATNEFVEGTVVAAPSANNSAQRNNSSCTDTDNNTADFSLLTPSDPRNSASTAVTCGPPPPDVTPTVASTVPANAANNVALNANITLTFSEPVTTTDTWYTISCTSGTRTASVTGGPTSYVLDPSSDFAMNDACTVTVIASQVTDQDDTPDQMAQDYSFSFNAAGLTCSGGTVTPIGQVQGTGETSPSNGSVVTVQGTVVADFEGAQPALRGFYLQDAGDSNTATSDGIFVFNGGADQVSLGQVVRVTGTAGENQGQTQLSGTLTVELCGTTNTVTPTQVSLPFASTTDAERYEGMLVQFNQKLVVSEHYLLARFGQVTLSLNERLMQPTNVVSPGAPALALQAQNNLHKIILDDPFNNQNADPILFGRGGTGLSAANTLRAGDSITNLQGVMTYTWGGNSASPNNYRVRVTQSPNFVAENQRPTSLELDGSLRVAGINVLNYFNTFGNGNCTGGVGGSATDCRGAENSAEFLRQADKTVAAIIMTQADIIGLMEIENDGFGNNSAVQDLVNRLNAATAPGTYALIDVDARTGQTNILGTDAIKVDMIYKPGKVSLAGTTAVLNTGAFGSFTTGSGTTGRNRPALTQSFTETSSGETFTVVVNHLKSKGSACTDNVSPVPSDPDLGDGQGNCNLTRKTAAQELVAWLNTDPTNVDDSDYLIIGDLNSYAMEDPITAIRNAGYVNIPKTLLGDEAYSYIFDGQTGSLDHALASTSLFSQVADVQELHINADEPIALDYNTNFKSPGQVVSLYNNDAYRASDHDPIVVGFDLGAEPTANFNTSAKTVSSTSVEQGEVFTYTLTIRNTGTAEGSFSLSDVINSNLEIVGVTGGLTVNSQTASVNSSLAPNTSKTYTIAVRSVGNFVGSVGNTAVLNSNINLTADSVTVNATSTPSFTVYMPLVTKN